MRRVPLRIRWKKLINAEETRRENLLTHLRPDRYRDLETTNLERTGTKVQRVCYSDITQMLPHHYV